MADFNIKANDTWPSMEATLFEPRRAASPDAAPVPVNLNGAAVDFIMRERTNSGASGRVVINQPAVVVDAAAGVVRYDWRIGDTAAPGIYDAEWQVRYSVGRKQTFPTGSYIEVAIRADLDGA